MNTKFKLAAYAVLLLLAAWFAWGFYHNYTISAREAAAAAAVTNDTAAVVTNNPVGTNSSAQASNAIAVPTNQDAKTPAPPAPPAHAVQGTMIAYLAALVGAIIGLGLLIAHDATQYFGSVMVDALLDDRGEGQRDPEYERAEQVWANGKYLDAIQMMRDFLKNNPREQYAALRIAEIYEKDLHNLLPAALEYEEVLKKKLPPERWGWAAIHLCNLYSKLNQQEKTMALLQRIVADYPKTAAAKKARSRLGLPEPEFESEPMAEAGAEDTETVVDLSRSIRPPQEEQAAPEPSAPAEPPKSNLPPGFRPKK